MTGKKSPLIEAYSSPSGSTTISVSFRLINSLITPVSSAKVIFPTFMTIPSIMANVSGIFMVITEPIPSSLSISSVPPIDWMFLTTTSIPTPRPDNSVTCSLVENPG